MVSGRNLHRAPTFASPKQAMFGDDAIGIAARARLHPYLGFTQNGLGLSVEHTVVSVDGSALSELRRRAIELVVVEEAPGAKYKEAVPGTT